MTATNGRGYEATAYSKIALRDSNLQHEEQMISHRNHTLLNPNIVLPNESGNQTRTASRPIDGAGTRSNKANDALRTDGFSAGWLFILFA